MKFWKQFINFFFIGGGLIVVPSTVSCIQKEEITKNENDNSLDIWTYIKEKNFNDDINNLEKKTIELSDQINLTFYNQWIQSLTYNDWNLKDGIIDNLFCDSERQALALYACNWGHFWNVDLHKNQEPKNSFVNKKFLNFKPEQIGFKTQMEVRGSDYKFIDQALKKTIVPYSFITYHGVEFMETEFWEQLKDKIFQNSDGTYNYSKIVGSEITSYGFISTTSAYNIAYNFSAGYDWINETYNPPLKEKVVFKIKIKSNSKGVGYVSGYNIMMNDFWNAEAQFLIKRNSKYKITNVTKDNDVNIFEMEMVE